jgi:hypothetical protein
MKNGEINANFSRRILLIKANAYSKKRLLTILPQFLLSVQRSLFMMAASIAAITKKTAETSANCNPKTRLLTR